MILEAWTREANSRRRIDAIPHPFVEMGCWRSVLLTFFVPFGHALPVSEELVLFLFIEIALEKGSELQLIEPFYILSGLRVHLYWHFALCFELVELILTRQLTVQCIISRFAVGPRSETTVSCMVPASGGQGTSSRQRPESVLLLRQGVDVFRLDVCPFT